jgi:hypothetical protein
LSILIFGRVFCVTTVFQFLSSPLPLFYQKPGKGANAGGFDDELLVKVNANAWLRKELASK